MVEFVTKILGSGQFWGSVFVIANAIGAGLVTAWKKKNTKPKTQMKPAEVADTAIEASEKTKEHDETIQFLLGKLARMDDSLDKATQLLESQEEKILALGSAEAKILDLQDRLTDVQNQLTNEKLNNQRLTEQNGRQERKLQEQALLIKQQAGRIDQLERMINHDTSDSAGR